MKLLLTGSTGFVGKSLTHKLIMEAHDLIAPVRSMEHLSKHKCLKYVEITDLQNDVDWMPVLEDIEVILHLASRVHVMKESASEPLKEFRKVNLDGTMSLARQAVKAGVKRFIFISSIKVNGEATTPDKPFTAADLPKPIDPYAISKAETEQALLELSESSGLEVVIIRPVLVYGPGVKANFRSLINYVNKGIPLPLGLIQNKRSLVALDNLVDLIITCIDHPAAVNQVFLISDGDDLSTTCLLQKVGKALDRPARLLPVPGQLIRLLATLIGKRNVSQRLLGSLQVDISKTRELLGWEPPVSVDEALKETAQSFLANK